LHLCIWFDRVEEGPRISTKHLAQCIGILFYSL